MVLDPKVKLPRLVAVTISTLYSLFLIGPIGGMYGSTFAMIAMHEEAVGEYPDSADLQNVIVSDAFVLFAAPPVAGWIASLIYLHAYVRREGDT